MTSFLLLKNKIQRKVKKIMENIEPVMLDVKSLSKSFENVQAVDNLSFQIRKGEIYGLLGPNGAGKTTTIKLILGLLEADEGDITVLVKKYQRN